MTDAVHNARNWKGKNTRVRVETDVDGIIWRKVYLHGNCIYKRSFSVESFNLCGWDTPTTRSRLHALGINVSDKKRVPYWCGERIATNRWYTRAII